MPSAGKRFELHVRGRQLAGLDAAHRIEYRLGVLGGPHPQVDVEVTVRFSPEGDSPVGVVDHELGGGEQAVTGRVLPARNHPVAHHLWRRVAGGAVRQGGVEHGADVAALHSRRHQLLDQIGDREDGLGGVDRQCVRPRSGVSVQGLARGHAEPVHPGALNGLPPLPDLDEVEAPQLPHDEPVFAVGHGMELVELVVVVLRVAERPANRVEDELHSISRFSSV